jgi:unsaturated chondroitin disaccharide hydrolase
MRLGMTQRDLVWADEAWNRTVAKVERTSKRIGISFPHASKGGTYDAMNPAWWTSGFWPGLLWLIYRENQDEGLKAIATGTEEAMDQTLREFYKFDHDAGFLWSLSSVAQYKLLDNKESKRRALVAASHLAARFNLRGGFIRAWNDKAESRRAGWVIIDCMMNLPLLHWASTITGDPRFSQIADAHADTVLREFIREEGSVHHVIVFDPETGIKLAARGGQGYSPDSSWSRGTAWALYGFILSYAYTQQSRYLAAAKRIAHYFLANLPDDGIPYWDFKAPREPKMCVDSSAAACAACGLLEIAKWVEPLEAPLYQQAGERITHSLYENYGAWNMAEEGLIIKGTANYNSGRYVDVSLIYGDYFFVEALSRLRGRTQLFW